MKALIIDDDLPSAEVLEAALRVYPDVEICGVARTLAEGEKLIASKRPDLIFLDMVFPDSDGSEWLAARQLAPSTRVVFYTGYRQYIHQAMKMRVFDFLLKPFEASELTLILDRMRLEQREPKVATASLPHSCAPGQRTLAITTVTNAKVILAPSDILYFRYHTDRKLWEVVLSNLKRYLLKRQTTAHDILESGAAFVRTHKRFIININYLGIIQGSDCIFLPPYDSITEVKVSKSFRRPLCDRFYDI